MNNPPEGARRCYARELGDDCRWIDIRLWVRRAQSDGETCTCFGRHHNVPNPLYRDPRNPPAPWRVLADRSPRPNARCDECMSVQPDGSYSVNEATRGEVERAIAEAARAVARLPL